MANVEFCDIAEVLSASGLQSSVTEADLGLLSHLKRGVEQEIRDFCRDPITETKDGSDYTRILPGTWHIGNKLQLPHMFVRSITSVYEDADAAAGYGSNDFSSDDLLTTGSDYYLDVDETGLSRSGLLVRMDQEWPVRPRTVKVTYSAGLTAAEIDADHAALQLAVVDEVLQRFQMWKAKQGNQGVVGNITSESIGGEYSVSYDTNSIPRGALMDSTRERLTKGGYVSYGVML